MNFLKSLWADLLDKRLWPVALALVLALVAVPLALSAGSDETGSAPVVVTHPDGTVAQVSLDPSTPSRGDRAGRERDPFDQKALGVNATGASGATGSTSTNTTSTTTTSPPTSTATTPTTTTPTTPTPPTTPKTTPAVPHDLYTVTLRTGRTGTKRPRKNVAELTPLPSADAPFFIYLGVLDGAKRAVFLLSSDVKASGDGTCKPRKSSCETVELEKGDTEYFDVTASDGTVTQYQLDLEKITRTTTAVAPSKAVAAALKTGAKKQARTATQVSADDGLGTDDYTFDTQTGLLDRVGSSAGFGAHLPTSRRNRASLQRWTAADELLPMPVWSPGL